MVDRDMDIVIVARDTWGDVWRRRQFLAGEFSKQHRVLFVERPFSLPRLLSASKDTTTRPVDRLSSFFTPPRKVANNLWVTAPLKPFPNHPSALADLNRKIEIVQLRRALVSLGMKKPVLWLTPEYAWPLADKLPHSLCVYDVTDDWTHAALPQRELDEITSNDSCMLRKADLVFAVSTDLLEKKAKHNPNTIWLPNGVDPALYDISGADRPAGLADIRGLIAGYTGSLHEDRLDLDLIEFLSRSSGFTQVFVGPDYLKPDASSRLKALPNVKLIPSQPHSKLPAFVFHFDACVIPHAVTPFTNSLDPIKVYEYLAAGKPVVSAAVRGVAHLSEFIEIARGGNEFLSAINMALSGKWKKTPEELKAKGRANSWKNRAGEAIGHIQRRIEEMRN